MTKSITAPEILAEQKKRVWPVIKKYLKDPVYPRQFSIPQKQRLVVKKYWDINKVYPERKGKYLRPTLVLLTAEALGTDYKKALLPASAMQLSEEWILIHDDIEDNSENRRGKPTLHKLYGSELAINAGDSLHLIMWKMINDCKNEKISEEFYKMLLRTALGQGVEQLWTNSKKRLSDSEYFFIADSKSAYYSIAGPMRLGAIIAKVSAGQIKRITDFGIHLGRCFQLVDDILDIDQDKKEKKSTLATSKGIKYTKKLAIAEKDKAREIFEKKLNFLSHQPARSKLETLIHFVLERDY
jgi:geranylgeranyl pyrophosphate synthase